MMELTVSHLNRVEEAHIYKIEKYLDLIKELRDTAYKTVVMHAEVGIRGLLGSSVRDYLTNLSICGKKRTKDLKLLAETVENSASWICSRMNERSLHKD